MQSSMLFDAAGRRRSPATMPGFTPGARLATRGRRYPADPPNVEEIVAVIREAGVSVYGVRLRGLVALLWRSGLRIGEALALTESDLDRERGAVLVRSRQRRQAPRDRDGSSGWEQLAPWLELRLQLPVGALFCVMTGPTQGHPWSSPRSRAQHGLLARAAGVRRRFAPHQLRHAHAVEMAREGVPSERHPTAAGPRRPRHHLDLPPRHRQLRDHRHSARPASTRSAGQHPAAPLNPCAPRQQLARPARTASAAPALAKKRKHGDATNLADRFCIEGPEPDAVVSSESVVLSVCRR